MAEKNLSESFEKITMRVLISHLLSIVMAFSYGRWVIREMVEWITGET
jgi:hypothetical protein